MFEICINMKKPNLGLEIFAVLWHHTFHTSQLDHRLKAQPDPVLSLNNKQNMLFFKMNITASQIEQFIWSQSTAVSDAKEYRKGIVRKIRVL